MERQKGNFCQREGGGVNDGSSVGGGGVYNALVYDCARKLHLRPHSRNTRPPTDDGVTGDTRHNGPPFGRQSERPSGPNCSLESAVRLASTLYRDATKSPST